MRSYLAFLLFSVILGCHGSPAAVSVSAMVPDAEEPRSPVVTLHMDTAFTEEERAAALEAANVWSKQTNGLAHIELTYDLDFDDLIVLNQLFTEGANLVVRRDSEDTLVLASDEESGCLGCVLGWMNSGGIHGVGHKPIHGAFVVDRFPDSNVRLQVMIHEFGHVLGLPHVDSPQSIMYPGVIRGRSACLKKADLVAFCSVNECGTVRMFPCE